MKRYPVVWRPQARADLLALYDWIAERADPETAFDYTSRIEEHAAGLAQFPGRGTPRGRLLCASAPLREQSRDADCAGRRTRRARPQHRVNRVNLDNLHRARNQP